MQCGVKKEFSTHDKYHISILKVEVKITNNRTLTSALK